MPHTAWPPIFISYARQSALTDARALKDRLGADAFLDESDIETRADFAQRIAEALLAARLIVVFSDDVYHARPVCRWELGLILAPYYRGQTDLSHVFITKPAERSYYLDPLPPELRVLNWDSRDLPRALREAATGPTLRERLEATGSTRIIKAHLESARTPPVMPLEGMPHWGIAPSLHDDFVGRVPALHALDREMTRAGDIPVTVAIRGGGGAGKTRLATEYVHRRAPALFPDGIFWIDCGGPEQLTQHYGVLRQLDPETPALQETPDVVERLVTAVRAAARTGRRMLFVLDNVPEKEGESPALAPYCPTLGLAWTLVTCRQTIPDAKTVDVEELDSDAAWHLLTRDLPPPLDLQDDEWDEIAAWVGKLPFALEILNRLLFHRGLQARAALQQARTRAETTGLDRHIEALPEKRRGLQQLLDISYRVLPLPARRAARILAHLAPEPIPMVLVDALERTGGVTSHERMQLTDHSLVTGKQRDDYGIALFGGMHRLLADYLRRQQSDPLPEDAHAEEPRRRRGPHDTPEDVMVAIDAVAAVFRGPDLTLDSTTDWPSWNRLRPHARELMRYERAEAQLGVWLGRLDQNQGLYTLSLESFTRAYTARLKLFGERHRDTLVSANVLAGSLYYSGQAQEALQRQRWNHETTRDMFGDDDPDTLMSANNLAAMLERAGDLPRARALLQEVFEVNSRVFGPYHRDTFTALNNLASLAHRAGDVASACRIGELLLELRRTHIGADHPATLLSANNLALALVEQGELPRARALLESVVADGRRTLGPEHPTMLGWAFNLYQLLRSMNDDAAAGELLRRELKTLLEQDPAAWPADVRRLRQRLIEELGDAGGAAGAR